MSISFAVGQKDPEREKLMGLIHSEIIIMGNNHGITRAFYQMPLIKLVIQREEFTNHYIALF